MPPCSGPGSGTNTPLDEEKREGEEGETTHTSRKALDAKIVPTPRNRHLANEPPRRQDRQTSPPTPAASITAVNRPRQQRQTSPTRSCTFQGEKVGSGPSETDKQAGRQTCRLAGRSAGWLTGRPALRQIHRLANQLQ